MAGTTPTGLNSLLAQGIEHHGAGRFGDAEDTYRQVLRSEPGNADALHLLGVLAHQRARNEQAADLIGRALAINPRAAMFHLNMGATLRALGRDEEAVAHYRETIALEPGDAAVHVNLGNALDDLGRGDDATRAYRTALALAPDLADAHTGLGTVLMKLDRAEEAGRHFRRAVELDPGSALAFKNLANLYLCEGDPEAGLEALGRAIELEPEYADAYADLGSMLWETYRPEESEVILRHAISLSPKMSKARNALGLTLFDMERFDEAVEQFRAILALDAADAEAYCNLGHTYREMGRFDDALECFDKALAIKPEFHVPRVNRGLLRLMRGAFADGWRDYIAYRSLEHKRPFLSPGPVPSDLAGKRVRVYADHGLGDQIFFLRFVAALKARGAWIAIDPFDKIASIVERVPFVDARVGKDDDVNEADLHYIASHLPHLLGMRTAADIPPPFALTPVPPLCREMRARLLEFGPPPYIGVTWRAGTQRHNSLSKVVPAVAVAEVLAATATTVVVLQRGPEEGEIDAFARALGRRVFDLTASNEDLEDMLALLSLLDDYVCVSNTNTHLRAGTGRTSRVLVPFPPDFRWLGEGDGSPWFPGCRVYRQDRDRDWGRALAALRSDLLSAFPDAA